MIFKKEAFGKYVKCYKSVKKHLVNFKANIRKIKSLDSLFKILHFIFKHF